MKHVLISLEEEYVAKLKRLAKDGNGMKRGAISATVKEGIDLVEKERKRQKAWKRLKELFDEDYAWGIREFKREDAYYGPRFN
ncbi:MAG: hypothetical protein AABW68_05125 [archaeon]